MAVLDVSRAGVILAVSDFRRSRAFYEEVLGFAVEALYDDPPYATLTRSGIRLSLAEEGHRAPDHDVLMTAPTERWQAPAVLVLEVADALAAHQALVAAGVEMVAPVYSPPWGGHRFFVRDPDGFLVEIEQPA